MISRSYQPAIAIAVLSMLVGAVTTVSAQAPAAQAPMNMPNMDQRGVISGTVRGATGPAADTAVVAVERRERRALRSDDRRSGRLRVWRPAGGQLQRDGRVRRD